MMSSGVMVPATLLYIWGSLQFMNWEIRQTNQYHGPIDSLHGCISLRYAEKLLMI
jgi:hypothetical protein